MTYNNNQDTDGTFNQFIDWAQGAWATPGLSQFVPKPVSEGIDQVNVLIDVQQEVDQGTGISTWKITVANLAGATAGDAILTTGLFLTRAEALAALSIGGPLAIPASAAIFYNGSVITMDLANTTQVLTHDAILGFLNSPGFIEAENAFDNWSHKLKNSLNDIIGKTTGWTQEPFWLNDLLKASNATLEGVTDLGSFLKAQLDALSGDAHTIGSYLSDVLKGLSRAEATAPNVVRRDPLTLDLDGDGVELVSLTKSNTFFDLDEDGLRERVGWVKADDGILVFDENANNSVDNINELFGYVDENGNEVTGTAELKTYDTGSVILVNQTDAFGTVLVDDNGNPLTQEVVIGANDGVIDLKDAIFSQLKLWQDLNQDGISQDGELRFLGDYNISSIDVTTTTTTNKNVEGNVIISTGTYQTSVTNEDGSITNSTKQYANLDLAIDQTNSSAYSYQDAEGNVVSYNLNLEVLALPLSRGYGNVAAWHVAMSEDSALLTMMKDMVNLTNGVTYDNLTAKVENFIYEWTGTQNITGNRGWFSGQKLAAMEEIRGIDFC